VSVLPALTAARVLLCLGAFGWDAALRTMAALGHTAASQPRFGHGAEADVGPWRLIGSYHPSQQNTFTGRLTSAMLVTVLTRANAVAAPSA